MKREEAQLQADFRLPVLACPACSAGMPFFFRYCAACGVGLSPGCASCGAGLLPQASYCGTCGAAVESSAPPEPVAVLAGGPPPPPLIASGAQEEQLRRVAVLFADLQGSTTIAEQLDRELAYRLVSECVAGLGRVVVEAGGYVVKTLGDGLMALFGAPIAHGDDAERAARAALGMQDWLRDAAGRIEAQYGVALRARVGINFGSVVAASLSAGGRLEYDVLGDTVNVAQRLEAAAEPGAICVSEPFYRITRGAFEYRHRGVAQVKGRTEPLDLYELVRAAPPHVGEVAGFPLVGREGVMQQLRHAVERLTAGESAFLMLAGGGGMGKSRLLDELSRELTASGLPTLHGSGVEAEQRGPLAIWRSWLLALLPVDPAASHGEAAAAIRQVLTRPEHLPWAEWLAALIVEPQRLLSLDADSRDLTVRRALAVCLEYWQQGGPAALLVDEADVLDSLSLGLLADAARQSAEGTAPPLLIGLAGRLAPRAAPGARLVPLEPLEPEAARSLVERALGGVAVDDTTVDQVVERAGGSPLFLTLILQAARESGDPAAALSAVPDSLYGLVQAQLDALPEAERRTAQSAAVLGRSFAERWLQAMCGRSRLSTPWRVLEQRGLLEEHRPAPQRELSFRHGALQEVLYEGLLSAPRREVHARAAAIISGEAGTHANLAARAAYHWRAAEEWPEALDWGLKAAEHSAALFADEAEAAYRECAALAERLEAPEAAARAEAGLGEIKEHRGEFGAALALAESAECRLERADQSVGVALRARIRLNRARVLGRTGAAAQGLTILHVALGDLEDPTEGEACRVQGQCLIEEAHLNIDLGQLAEAERSARRALKLADDAGWTREAAAAASALGRVYPLQGNWPAAEEVLRRAADLAEQGGNWKEAAGCWINLGSGLQTAGRLAEAADAQRRALEYAERIGDAEKIAIIRMNLGTVLLNRGDWNGAEAMFRAALALFKRMEHHLGAAYSHFNLVEALRLAGRLPEAQAAFSELQSVAGRVDAPQLRVHSLLADAELEMARGNSVEAAYAASIALGLAEELGYETGVNQARLTRGRALRLAEDWAPAREHLEAAVRGFDQAQEPLEAARARAELAAVARGQGKPGLAHTLRAEALATLTHLGAEAWAGHFPD